VQHKSPVVVDFAQKQKPAIMQRCDSGQLDARKSLPMRRSRADLHSKLARAANHGADTYGAASAAIAELVGLGADAMKAQEQSQGAKPEVCGVGISILDRHFLNQPFAAGRV
jgi:hypothetical protein